MKECCAASRSLADDEPTAKNLSRVSLASTNPPKTPFATRESFATLREHDRGGKTGNRSFRDGRPRARSASLARECEINEITANLLESRPGSLRVKLRDIRGFVVCHMQDIRAIVDSDTAQARAVFAKHVDKITLTSNGVHYLASGKRDCCWA